MTVKELQNIEDVYLEQLNDTLSNLDAYEDWDWPEYVLTEVSAVVLGCREVTPDQIEVVYSVTVESEHAIPHVGQGTRVVNNNGSYFTFVQAANSVETNDGYETQLFSTYVGSQPEPDSASKAKPKSKSKKSNAVEALDADDQPTKPHPP